MARAESQTPESEERASRGSPGDLPASGRGDDVDTPPASLVERGPEHAQSIVTLRAGYEALAREAQELREELTQRRIDETRFRRFFDLPLIGMAVTSPDRRFLDVNEKLCQILGYRREELIGRDWASITHPDDRAGNLSLLDGVLSGKSDSYSMDKRYIHRDGHIVYVSISVCCVRRPDGTADHFGLTVQDVTLRHQVQEQQTRHARHVALRADVHAAFSGAAEPLQGVLQRTAEAIVRHLQGAFARIWTLREGTSMLELEASAGLYTHLDGPHSGIPFGHLLVGKIAERRAAHLTNDVLNDPSISDRDWAQREGMVAFVGVPLLIEGRAVGVAGMFARHPLESDTLEAFEAIADTIAQGIERRQADEALRREVTERARAEQLARAHATLITSTLDYLRREPTAEAFVGHVLRTIVDQLGGMGGTFSLPGPEPGTAVAYMMYQDGRLMRGEESDHPGRIPQRMPYLSNPWTIQRSGPEVLDVRYIETSPLYAPYREWARRLGVKTVLQLPLNFSEDSFGVCAVRFGIERTFSQDELELTQALAMQASLAVEVARLTHQAQEAAVAQERVVQLARANAALTRTLDSLASEASLDSALGEVLIAMTRHVGSAASTMWLYELAAGTANLHLFYEHGRVVRSDQSDHPQAGTPVSLQGNTLHAALLDGKTAVVEVRPENGFEMRICEYLHAQGVHSELCVPMTAAGKVVGCCVVRLTGPTPQPEQIEFARVLAQQATLTLLVTRMTEVQQRAALLAERERVALARAIELDQANVALQRTVSILAAAGDLKALMEQVLLEAAGVVDAHMACIFLHDQPTDSLTMSWCVLEQRPVDLALDPRFEFWRTSSLPGGASIAWQRTSQTGRHAWFSHNKQNPEIPYYGLDWQLEMGHCSSLVVPLAPGEQPAGLMALYFLHDVPPETERIEWARVFAHQAALAIMLARSADQAREAVVLAERERMAHERAMELAQINSMLHEALELLTSEPVVDRFLAYVLQKVVEQFGAYSSSLLLPDAKRQRAYFHLTYQDGALYDAEAFASSPVSIAVTSDEDADRRWAMFSDPRTHFVADIDAGEPMVTWTNRVPARETREPWRSYALPSLRAALQSLGVRAFSTTPLCLGDRVLGRLIVRFRNPRHLEPGDVELLQSVANQMAVALHMARLAEQGRDSAIFAERNRFARDIHDTIAQGLTGVIIQLEAAKDAIARRRGQDTDAHIQRAADLARQSLAEARRSVHALKPLALEAAGLRAAFETLLANMTTGTGVDARLTVSGKMSALRPDWEENLLRIGQEALTNALRHANPRHFNAVLAFGTDHVTLTCSDDGSGFDPRAPVTGMGLRGMQERAARMGWKLDIRSRVGQGSEILVQLAWSIPPPTLPASAPWPGRAEHS